MQQTMIKFNDNRPESSYQPSFSAQLCSSNYNDVTVRLSESLSGHCLISYFLSFQATYECAELTQTVALIPCFDADHMVQSAGESNRISIILCDPRISLSRLFVVSNFHSEMYTCERRMLVVWRLPVGNLYG